MQPKFVLALSALGLVAGCSFSPRPPLADGLELSPSPVTIELGKIPPAPPPDAHEDDEQSDAPRLLPPFVPDHDEWPDTPRLFRIKY
jgi:hypothetical protein